MERYRDAELCLDVTHPEPSGPLVITPAIRVEGEGHAGMIVNAMVQLWRARAGKLRASMPGPLARWMGGTR